MVSQLLYIELRWIRKSAYKHLLVITGWLALWSCRGSAGAGVSVFGDVSASYKCLYTNLAAWCLRIVSGERKVSVLHLAGTRMWLLWATSSYAPCHHINHISTVLSISFAHVGWDEGWITCIRQGHHYKMGYFQQDTIVFLGLIAYIKVVQLTRRQEWNECSPSHQFHMMFCCSALNMWWMEVWLL